MNRHASALICLAVLAVLYPSAASAEVAVARCGAAPQLDGRLDDPCWRDARWQSAFRHHADPDEPATHDTRFAFVCDGEFLYLAAEMKEPEPGKLVANVAERDGNVYRDDCLQVFVDPNRDDEDYFVLSVNSVGTIRDSKGVVVAWDSEARAKAHVAEASWSVELAIPLGDLELTAACVGKPWGLNVTRVRRAGAQAELSTFAPVRGSFHQPAAFVPMDVTQEVLAPYLWDVEGPAERTVGLVDGTPTVRGKYQIRNQTGRFRFFLIGASVRGEGEEAKGTPTRDGLDNGDQHFVEVASPTAGVSEGMLVVSLHDALEPRRLLARRQTKVELAYSPLSITMTVPWYKNAIFATQTVEQVELSVHSDLPDDALQGATMAADIRRGTEIVAGPVRAGQVQRDTPVSIPAADLPVGDHQVRVALLGGDGNELHTATTGLRKLPPHPGEVRFDRNMACLEDGEPFLPFGWFGVRMEQLEAFAAQGYNTVGAYGPTCTNLTDHEVKAYLDKAESLGMKVICRPQPTLAVVRSAHKLLTPKEEEAIRALVRKWRDHPAVLGWYMCDEPEGKPEPLERRLQEYRIVDEEDPFHPAIVLNNTVSGIHKYHPSGDLLMPDVYPGYLQAGGASRNDRPTQAMIACREATGGRKPVWVTPQGQIQVVEGHRGPTFRELRNQAWQCAAYDATGFFWYRDSFLPNLPHSQLGAPYVHQELRAVAEAVRSKSLLDVAKADVGTDRLTLATKKVGDQFYIIAVNLVWEDMGVQFEVDGLGDRPLLVLSEARHLAPKSGKFADSFRPHEAHVYTTDTTLTDLTTVAEVEARIDAEIRRRHKPGNLAYRTTGAQVVTQHHGGQAPFLNDGVTDGVWWPREWGKPSHPLPNWVELRFPKPTSVGRVVVYSCRSQGEPPSLRDAEVQIAEGETWTTVARIAANDGEPATATFAPREVERLRLLITRATGGRLTLQEIEAYAS